ncbi:MAG: hypothetical protein INH41_25600 [Myxococcaceae bacterium]|jgi:hypothetical protein|nr:hypothetical protein [Myxococcaceae bacterium]MCA3015776.1 hypothetical protein [Myxococcaceae bacterium]
MRRWLVVLVGLCAAVGLADVPAPSLERGCRQDADCVLSNFQGCCDSACCPSPPRAWHRGALRVAQAACRAPSCGAPPVCEERSCPPQDARPLEAACEGGRCVARVAGPRDDVDACERDDDCVSRSSAGCCGSCCPAPPVAVTRRRAELEHRRCAATECALPDCTTIACAQVMPEPIRPVCRERRCVALQTNVEPMPPPPPAECLADADCGVARSPRREDACWRSACGCCPTVRVVPAREASEPPPPPTAPAGPRFGLATGSAPACAPCPPPPPVTPRCVTGRCVAR